MSAGEELLFLTPKGLEELHKRAYELDSTGRKILSLIGQGCTTAEAILQRSTFSRNTVIDGLRRLLGSRFVEVATGGGAVASRALGKSNVSGGLTPEQLRLASGVSLSEARFSLCDFCLDQFGMQGQELVDVVNLCSDVIGLQQVLNSINIEVQNRCPERLPVLLNCVREINETGL